MRVIVFLLLVANLAYAAWHFYLDKTEAQRPVAPEVVSGDDGMPLVLLSELQEQELQDSSTQAPLTSLVPQAETSPR
jgi:hypothetical protein